MSNFEFIEYRDTPEDGNNVGIATIKVNVPIVVKYKVVKKKDGSGTFYGIPSIAVTKNGQKEYENVFFIDSRIHEEQIIAFMKNGIRGSNAPIVKPNPNLFEYPIKQSETQKTVKDEELPF